MLLRLHRRYILIYHELKCQIILSNATQAGVLVLRAAYSGIITFAGWPSEKDSKYGELFIRIICEMFPLVISVIIFQKAAVRYIR